MKKIPGYILAAILIVLSAGCGGKKASQDTAFHPVPFPAAPKVPSLITDGAEANEYVAAHFWDAFLGRTLPCDTNIVNGVLAEDVESAVGTYVTVLEQGCGLDFARKAIGDFVESLERFQASDTASNVFGFLEKTVSKYLYDPNSPVRSEDLYLPFAAGLASSPFVPEGMRQAYAHDARMCSLNQTGTVAADFSFTDLSGHRHSLHAVKADYTLLFFSNPGCPACKEIIDGLTTDPRIAGKVDSGKLAVVNVYIDSDLDEWREYAVNYPETWLSGYDQSYTIRTDVTYNVRAIPSLYLLDEGKRVIMKDAPSDKVLSYIANIE
ncbi:MAG: DUF5106 domain-containing protein [Bacteroidales bacterium]|nr:DUF5106 domain-containing protein [Bacteroidales bacterium]